MKTSVCGVSDTADLQMYAYAYGSCDPKPLSYQST